MASSGNSIFDFVENHTDAFACAVTSSAKWYNKKMLLISPLALLLGFLSSRRQVDILFLDDRFDYLIKKVSEKFEVGLIFGTATLKTLTRVIDGRGKEGLLWWERYLLNRAFLSRCKKKRERLSGKAMRQIEKKILRANPKVLVLWGDSLYLNRAIICASRKIGVPTVVLQHGVIYDGMPLNYLDGTYADYFFVWSEYVKNYYVEKNLRNSTTTKIMGYQFKRYVSEKNKSRKEKKVNVCIIGQGLYDYYDEFKEIYIEVIEGIVNTCIDLDYNIIYRPHPGESIKNIRKFLPEDIEINREASLAEAFENNDVFFGFNSTALIEATLSGRVSCQIYTPCWAGANFGELGYAYTIDNTKSEIKAFLLQVDENKIAPKRIKEECLVLPADIANNFVRCLHEIGVKFE